MCAYVLYMYVYMHMSELTIEATYIHASLQARPLKHSRPLILELLMHRTRLRIESCHSEISRKYMYSMHQMIVMCSSIIVSIARASNHVILWSF